MLCTCYALPGTERDYAATPEIKDNTAQFPSSLYQKGMFLRLISPCVTGEHELELEGLEPGWHSVYIVLRNQVSHLFCTAKPERFCTAKRSQSNGFALRNQVSQIRVRKLDSSSVRSSKTDK